MVKKILLVLAVVVVGFLAVVATRPADFVISRSTLVAAPPEVVYAQVADFHGWAAWSPWEKLDPAMKKSFDGAAGAPGSTYAWNGNDKVGEGRMTVASVRPAQEIAIKLEFLRPFAARNDTLFRFTPEAGGTRALWSMSGRNNFMAKAAGLFMNLDAMVGGDFERGLAALKTVAETAAKNAGAPAAAAPAAAGTPAAGAPAAAAPAPAAGEAKGGGVGSPY